MWQTCVCVCIYIYIYIYRLTLGLLYHTFLFSIYCGVQCIFTWMYSRGSRFKGDWSGGNQVEVSTCCPMLQHVAVGWQWSDWERLLVTPLNSNIQPPHCSSVHEYELLFHASSVCASLRRFYFTWTSLFFSYITLHRNHYCNIPIHWINIQSFPSAEKRSFQIPSKWERQFTV